MLILILYWIVTMISGTDFDIDFDVDIDVDIDADIDTSIEGGNLDFEDVSNTQIEKEHIVGKRRKPLKWWQVFLVYFNFVGLPFMFAFTCWIFIWWALTTVTTTITNSYDNSFGVLIMLLAFIPSLFINKIFTMPFKSFFKNFSKEGDLPIDIIGRRGVCLSTIKDNKMGSAEIIVEKTPLSIYVKSLNGEQINFRDPILIIKQSTDKNYYYAQSYKTN
ncbi:hypothetical protein [Polaribacter sp. Hel_I_88]|uniref:hypothetical protein n=1 Tax=Polaribacter sp. Hel_I_88 TaxID=1250006 RepID=UPI00068E61C5|nr:hypothetical protein [Polaribacter sp. Hel_I_88]